MNAEYIERLQAAAKGKGFSLRDEVAAHRVFVAPPPPIDRRVVKTDAKLHVPTLNLADYVASSAEPPPAVHRSNVGFNWGVLMNDQLGDCGPAMAIHADEAFHLDAGTPVPPYADIDAVTFYEEEAGYVPGNPATDGGSNNNTLAQRWTNPGILCKATGQRSQIAASIFIDPKDPRLTRIGIWEFIAVFRAIGLPTSAQSQHSYWQVTDKTLTGAAALGSWGYHDIPILSYDDAHQRDISWGIEMLVDWDFDTSYGVGGFVVVTKDQLNNKGVSPSGVDWSALNADIQKLPSVPAN